DGPADGARFQHPIGLAFHDGAVYVADTYNNRVRRFDLKTQRVSTLLGGREAGFKDGDAAASLLNEPCGLAFAGDKLYIADTNNQVIRVFDFKTNQISSLTLTGLSHPGAMPPAPQAPGETLPAQTAGPGEGTLTLTLKLPEGTGVNPDAPSLLEVASKDGAVAKPSAPDFPVTETTVTLPLTLAPGQTELSLNLTLFYCSHGQQALCYFKRASLKLPLTVAPGGPKALSLSYAPR
ncbi:MAG TPA: hypothetical protein VMU88_06930, partial [bacterium]|nr:hypothetical protein [bacterium]